MKDRLYRVRNIAIGTACGGSDSLSRGMDVRSRPVLSVVSCQLFALAWDCAWVHFAADDLPYDRRQLGPYDATAV